MMKRLSMILTIAILFALAQKAIGKPLKALLYGYLPSATPENSIEEYQKLSQMINKLLDENNINVIVKVCDQGEAAKLYDPIQINSLFNDYDIVQVDVTYLWAVKVDLMSFTKDEINYFNKVFPFQWEPLSRFINGKDSFVGSPGLLCSTFLETRKDAPHEDRLYGKEGAYELTGLYLNYFINSQPNKNLDNIDYSVVDPQTIAQIANFLKKCQNDTTKFDYDSNWCLKQPQEFLDTNYSTTTGYSQNLFNLVNSGISVKNLKIEHVTGNKTKKIFYSDSFIAKSSRNKQTILRFYQFMLSNQILDIYINGKYTNKPSKTYLIPPTINYLNDLSKEDPLYNSIYETAFKDKTKYVLYQEQYAKNVFKFSNLINSSLRKYRKTSDAQSPHLVRLPYLQIE